jgi:hypothetical protein
MDTVLLSLRIHMLTVEPGSFADKKTIAELDLKDRCGIKEYGLRRDNAMKITTAVTTCLHGGGPDPFYFRQDHAGDCRAVLSPAGLIPGGSPKKVERGNARQGISRIRALT